ncbi:hypothetical protein [Streptomyces niveus]|uniref:hypothetical protein n=1 Tax=Streptomyces niveus TaxID=193462 RepID=UPI0003C5E6BC|nr:hypothetical protein [Streptomyces niveus]EST22782.1 hypothetical protein M877_28810 [Streptomyces niveus NCIMB 11891]
MARLQILELPEGTDDTRPPFVLVIDESAPQRVIIGMDHGRVRDHWQDAAERIGARGAIVTAETVEIPANQVADVFRTEVRESVAEMYESARRSLASEAEPIAPVEEVRERHADPQWKIRQLESKFKEQAEAQHRRDLDLMDAVTDALGLDRLRDWDEILDVLRVYQRDAAAGRMPARGVYRNDGSEYVSGHLFGAPGFRDPVRCCRCQTDRIAWGEDPAERSCDVVLHMTGRD